LPTPFLTHDKERTIELRREVSAAGPRSLRASIMAAIGEGDRHVVVDCFGWERLDLVVLSTLVQGAKACAALGATFELSNLSGPVRDDIVALRLDRRLGLVA
jgi:anti-anti-sigma regulatory factor